MEITCYYNRRRLILFPLILLVFAGIPPVLFGVVGGSEIPVWGWGVLALMLLASVFGLIAISKRLFDRDPQLVINEWGFHTKRPARVSIPWNNIENIQAIQEVEREVGDQGRESKKISYVIKVWVKEVTPDLGSLGVDPDVPDIGGGHRFAPFVRDLSALKPGQKELAAFLKQAKSEWMSQVS